MSQYNAMILWPPKNDTSLIPMLLFHMQEPVVGLIWPIMIYVLCRVSRKPKVQPAMILTDWEEMVYRMLVEA